MDLVEKFQPSKLLNNDPVAHSMVLLGSCNDAQAILILKKTAFQEQVDYLRCIERTETVESNDIYHTLRGWFSTESVNPDVKIDLICPATDAHIRKYTKQSLRRVRNAFQFTLSYLSRLIRETPDIYTRILKPYISAIPPERTSWVNNILSYESEAEKIMYVDDDFIILPDFKWDLKDVNTLYLQAIVRDKTLKSLRDLRWRHLPMLRQIRRRAHEVVNKFGVDKGGIRMYFHYQPSYYHLHVHIVQVNYTGFPGMSVGQAHLLDDVISLLELDGQKDEGNSIMERMTFSYTLGEFHPLYTTMVAAMEQEDI